MENRNTNYLIPLAIFIAGLCIALGLFLSNYRSEKPKNRLQAPQETFDFTMLPDVHEQDHILGSPNARITLIEYSDLDCPACKSIHPTLKRLVAQYAKNGSFAWVYRHFPLEQLHTGTTYKAAASECVATYGGEKEFWNFIDEIFNTSNETQADLVDFAERLGLDREQFQSCATAGQYLQHVEKSYEDARAVGANGTPFIVILYPEGIPSGTITQIEQAGLELDEPGTIQVLDNATKIVIQAPFSFEVFDAIIKALIF